MWTLGRNLSDTTGTSRAHIVWPVVATLHGSEAERTSPPFRAVLRGFRVAVTSDRRADDLITALVRRGADVLHAPALRISPHEEDDALIAQTLEVISAEPDVVLVSTGYGMRRWFDVADAAGLGAQLAAVLDRASVLARGPKALGAVRAAGLERVRATQHETTASMVDELLAGPAPRCVAVQVHGLTDTRQLERLRSRQCRLVTVTPYRWVPPEVDGRVPRLIEAICARQVDAVTFTSPPGAAAVMAAAADAGRLDEVVAAFDGPVLAAAVGPVTAAALADAGVTAAVPERYRLGALIRLVCDGLDARVIRMWFRDRPIELRGRAVAIGDEEILLGPTAVALLRRLAATDGVVSKAELGRCLPDNPDEHAVEVAMSRLRAALGTPRLVTTVVKRGYRLNATRARP